MMIEKLNESILKYESNQEELFADRSKLWKLYEVSIIDSDSEYKSVDHD